jgi:hypothetical protein
VPPQCVCIDIRCLTTSETVIDEGDIRTTESHLNTTKARMASKATVLDTAAAWQGIVRTQWTIPMERAQTPII